ncbi:putative e3 ubiquitin-protein ligase bre1 protein [Botrytis cinerea BcDW1]|nr:putative e3 ubiquitin-protein ligase bre1 protein [Botrytis cinerea BcDW1]
MTPVAASAPSLPSFIKMEDRKRAAGQSTDDLAPPTKRQATNGAGKASADSENTAPWSEDIEKYQKDAIYRQMLEYKREKATLESQLKTIQKKSTDHDDHLRIIDAWWTQLLEEVTLLAENDIPNVEKPEISFSTSLQFHGIKAFSDQLASKGREIKSKLHRIFTAVAAAHGKPSADLQDLQAKVTKMLASQKEYLVTVDRLRNEKEELNELLELASLRYVKAEKRLDRLRSDTVRKEEAKALFHSTANGAKVENGVDTEMTNGITEDKEANQSAYKEAQAVVEKQKEQLEAMAAENKSLTEQITAASIKQAPSDDDYARTELFKQFRIQHEDVIKRINHLEATNIQLREEAEKLQAERTAYRIQIENEAETTAGELESQLQRLDADLTRIRSARDELLADLSVRKAKQDQDDAAVEHLKELVGAKDDRITSLELEVERLRQIAEQSCQPTPGPEIDSLNLEELRVKYDLLQQGYDSINKELPALQSAYKRVQALTSKKVMDFTALEEKVSILAAEKSKADQKYFAARKDMDIRLTEVRTLKNQNAKSSEIISQLKDVETSDRTLLSNLEKQLSDMRQSNASIMTENKKLEASSREATSKCESLKNQAAELTNLLKSKDSANSGTKQKIHAVELENEQLRVRCEQIQKDRDTWKQKSLSNQSGEEEMLRTLALCTVCRANFKNTVLKTCGHLFCNSCVDDRISNRMRKCPNCAKPFDKLDVMTAHM